MHNAFDQHMKDSDVDMVESKSALLEIARHRCAEMRRERDAANQKVEELEIYMDHSKSLIENLINLIHAGPQHPIWKQIGEFRNHRF